MTKSIKSQCINASDLITIAGLKNRECYSVQVDYDGVRLLMTSAAFARVYRKFGCPKSLEMDLLQCGSLHCRFRHKSAVWVCIVDREFVESMRASLSQHQHRLAGRPLRIVETPVLKPGQLLLVGEVMND